MDDEMFEPELEDQNTPCQQILGEVHFRFSIVNRLLRSLIYPFSQAWSCPHTRVTRSRWGNSKLRQSAEYRVKLIFSIKKSTGWSWPSGANSQQQVLVLTLFNVDVDAGDGEWIRTRYGTIMRSQLYPQIPKDNNEESKAVFLPTKAGSRIGIRPTTTTLHHYYTAFNHLIFHGETTSLSCGATV